MLYVVYFILWMLWFMVGASVFSFLTAAADRLTVGENIVFGRSRCDSCGHRLSAWELIPCFSFLALTGRCKACGAGIPLHCFVMEVLGGLGAVACAQLYGSMPVQGLLVFAVMCILAVTALIDWKTREIWDRFWMLLFLCGTAAIWVFPHVTFMQRVIGCLAVSAPMLVVALLVPGGFGGGDIKLMFAGGWLLGWQNALCAVFLAILMGGGYSMWLLVKGKAGRKDVFAFGPFLCLGIVFSLLWGDGLMAWYIGLL